MTKETLQKNNTGDEDFNKLFDQFDQIKLEMQEKSKLFNQKELNDILQYKSISNDLPSKKE